MPYQNRSDLPEQVTDSLPEHGQDIYKEAFNSAWDEYDQSSDRKGDRDREETAHAVAWSAVKQVYEKDSEGNWVESAE